MKNLMKKVEEIGFLNMDSSHKYWDWIFDRFSFLKIERPQFDWFNLFIEILKEVSIKGYICIEILSEIFRLENLKLRIKIFYFRGRNGFLLSDVNVLKWESQDMLGYSNVHIMNPYLMQNMNVK
jgi:hypothetical protein